MMLSNGKIAGALLLLGTGQFVIMMLVAEALYPGYSVSHNFISDLGVGRTAPLFNGSLIVTGIMTLVSARYIDRSFAYRPLTMLMAITGLGAIGAGIFPENTGVPHIAFAVLDFGCGTLVSLIAAKVCPNPMKVFGVISAGVSAVTIIMMISGFYLGLGIGGMERMIAYPMLLWMLAFSGYMMGANPGQTRRS